MKTTAQTKFLVTGGAGFIGSNIAAHLVKEGAQVRVLDNLATGYKKNIESLLQHKNFQFVEGDIRDYKSCLDACSGVDVVLHQAALGSVPRSIKDPLTTNAVNVDGFVNMLFATKENNINRFVYASSSSVYGNDTTMPKIENKTGELLSPYAVSKYTNELYARVFSKTYDMQTIGLRYFNVFGPNQSPDGPYAAVIPLFMQAAMKNESPTIFGDGQTTRDFTFVENVIQANLRAATATIPDPSLVVNIAYGETTSLNRLFELIAGETGFKGKPVYGKERVGDIKNSWADISLAKEKFGYNPSIRLEEGIRKTVAWFKETNNG